MAATHTEIAATLVNMDPNQAHLFLDFPANITASQRNNVTRSYLLGRNDAPLPNLSAQMTDEEKLSLQTAYQIGDNYRLIKLDQKVQTDAQLAARPREGKAKISPPTKYSGDRTKYNEFVTQCRLNFSVDPMAFPTEQVKMAYVGSYLEKNAYTWFSSSVDKETGVINFENLNSLLEKLKRGFADPDELATANREIRKLKQKTTVAAYFSEFTHWANILDLNNSARRYQFDEGLSDEVKDALANHAKLPEEFLDYVDDVSAIDGRLFGRRQAKGSHPKPPTRQNLPVQRTVQTHTTTTRPLAITGTHPGPMDTSAGAGLTGKARTEWRKANNLCPYCGDKHKLENCPKLAAKNSRAAAATTTSATPAQVLYSTPPAEN
jgi:hypothetical protein